MCACIRRHAVSLGVQTDDADIAGCRGGATNPSPLKAQANKSSNIAREGAKPLVLPLPPRAAPAASLQHGTHIKT